MRESLLFILIIVFCFSFIKTLDIDISKFRVASIVDQIILVIPPNYTSTSAILYFYVREGNNWVQRKETNAFIGANGLGKEREGDSKTPVGVYKFNCYFGIEDNPGTNLSYIKVNQSHYWDADSKSKNYNTLVNNETYSDFNVSESEHIIDINPGYEYCLNMDYNEEQTPYKGAAIFLHCFTGRNYTGGCVAIEKNELRSIYREINEDCHIIIDTMENMTKYYSSSNFIKFGLTMIISLMLII